MKTRIARDVATARRPGRPIPAAMGTAGWAQAEADRARVRTVLRAPSDWKAPATTSVPASITEHGVAVRTGGHALDPAQPRTGEQTKTIGTHFHAQPFQAKLAVGRIDDPLEREADRVADSVASGRPVGAIAVAPSFGVQRECAECEEEKKALRRKCASDAAERAAHAPAAVDRVVAGPGKPLEPALRQDMEGRFRHDFGRVRVHADGEAAESARQVNARAYAVGPHVVFAADEFSPATVEGRQLLAHELTHVVQQGGGATTVQRQPKSKADQEREAAIERARIGGAFCTNAQDKTQSEAEQKLRLIPGKSDDKKYAVSLGWKDRALIQKKLAVSPQLLWEIATKARFFSGEAKAAYWQLVGNAVIDFGGSDAGLAILESCAPARPSEAEEGAESTEATPPWAASKMDCDIAKQQYEIEYEDDPSSSRCMDIKTDTEFTKNYFDSNIASAVAYSVPATTWDNVAYDSFKVMLVKYRNGTSEYFVLDDVGVFHSARMARKGMTQMSMLPSKYVKRKTTGLVYPLDRGQIYLLSEHITPHVISLKNGLKYQVKDLQGLYNLLQIGGTFASIMGLYAVGVGTFKTSISAFKRAGPARLAGRPLPGIGVKGSRSTTSGTQGGEAVRAPGKKEGAFKEGGEEGTFKGDPKAKGKTSGGAGQEGGPGSKRTSTIEEQQSAGERTTTTARGSGEYRPLDKNPDIGVLEVRDDGSVSIVSANRQGDLEPGVKVQTHIQLANHPNGLGPITPGAARYRLSIQNGKVTRVEPLSRSPQTPERVGEIHRALQRNRLVSDEGTMINLAPEKPVDALKTTVFR